MATEIVSSGTTSSGLVVGAGDTLDILSGGVAVDALVSSGGRDIVLGQGSNTFLSAFATETVSSGGFATDTQVASAAAQVTLDGGTATGTVIASGGEAFVLSGGLDLAALVQAGGFLSVSAGGIADGTTVSSGGTVLVLSGGLASGGIVAGGSEILSDGGRSMNETILDGGSQVVSAGGAALGSTIGGGGFLVLSSGAAARNTLITDSGTVFVSSAGTTTDDVVSSGGVERVLSGGVSSDTTVEAFGLQVVSAGGLAIGSLVESAGALFVSAFGTASTTTVGSGGEAYVLSNGLLQDALLRSGGYAAVSAGGAAVGTVVQSGGLLSLREGGLASGSLVSGEEDVLYGAETVDDAVLDGGFLMVSAGGVADSTAVGSGGFVVVSSGGATSGAVVSAGGTEVLAGGAAIATTLLSGGRIDLDTLPFATGGTASFSSATDMLTVVEGGETASLQLDGSYTGLYFQLSADTDGSTIVTAAGTPCYCRGTLIETDRGEVPVEALRIGDLLRTASGALRPLRWIGRRSYDGRFAAGKADLLPILFRPGSLGDGVPRRDLLVSPLHAMLLDDVLVPAALLVNRVSIMQVPSVNVVDYIHLELDTHDILLAEGAAAESFVDDDSRGMFLNAPEFAALYPDRPARPARYCAPLLDHGDRVEELRARLAALAVRTAAACGAAAGSGIDGADHQRIEGWIARPGMRLRLLDNGRTIGVVEADLAAEAGDGSLRFRFEIPGGLDPRQRHVIAATPMVSQDWLPGSGAMLFPAGSGHGDPVAARGGLPAGPNVSLGAEVAVGRQVDDGARYGHLDVVQRGRIGGWAWNSADPGEAVAVQIFCDGHLLCRVVANGHRPDLEAAGIGTGRHGFQLELADELSPLLRHVVHARIERGGRALIGAPTSIEAGDAFDGGLEASIDRAVSALAESEQDRVMLFLSAQLDRLKQQIADRAAGRRLRDGERRARRRAGPAGAAMPRLLRALVIDGALPAPDRDAGSQAILSHVRALQGLGYAVCFVAVEEFHAAAETCGRFEALGITLCGAPLYGCVEEVLRRQANCFDVVYLHRIDIARDYMALVRRTMTRARVLYSVADLHHLRVVRQAKVQKRPELTGLGNRVRLEECTAAWQADAVLTHSPAEADLLRRTVPAASVFEVPWAVTPGDPTGRPAFAARRGVMFVGHYRHEPNEDAAAWLVEAVMPLVWAQDPTIPCLLVGSAMTPRIAALHRRGVELHGDVPALDPLWNRVRLSVAPLRFGAGIKGKVLDSMAAGVPCAMTPIAAEGLSLPASLLPLVADGAEALAACICRLHGDPELHRQAVAAGHTLLRDRHGEEEVSFALSAAIDGRRQGVFAVSAA